MTAVVGGDGQCHGSILAAAANGEADRPAVRTIHGVSAAPSEPSPTDLPTHFVPADVEGPLYERWVERGYFTADPDSGKPPWSLVIPPPNVTGTPAHRARARAVDDGRADPARADARLRHAVAARHGPRQHRGATTSSSATSPRPRARAATDYTREEFIAKAWDWKNRYGGQILGQMRRLGDGVDWSRERFTMDDGLSRGRAHDLQAALRRRPDLPRRADHQLVPARHDRALRRRGRPRRRAGRARLDPLRRRGDASIVVATTRAETMLGDTAVAVHPDDERYRHLVGTHVALPLTNRAIPIVADEHVDPSFGTGAVKVTPAHDPNDFEIGRRHDLPMPTIMDERARDHRARPVRRASTAWRRATRSSRRCARRAASSPRSVPTCTRSGTARAATR